jgi:hypothetical protein
VQVEEGVHVLADIYRALADAADHLRHDVLELHGHDTFLGQECIFSVTAVMWLGSARGPCGQRSISSLSQFAQRGLRLSAMLMSMLVASATRSPTVCRERKNVARRIADIDIESPGARREFAHLIGNDGKAAPGLAGTGRFNGGIKGQ